MSSFKLCADDQMTQTLKKLFNATPVRVPETKIQPLCVVARKKAKASFRGELKFLLDKNEAFAVPLRESQVADLSGKNSKNVDLDLGLQIMEGFLKGFGLPSSAFTSEFHGVKKVSFSFKNVKRYYVDINELGLQIARKKLDLENPSISIFTEAEPWEMLLIDSVITSSDFTISTERESNVNFAAKIDKMQQVLSGANSTVKLSSSSGYDLTFQGDQHLSFAFSTVQLFIDRTKNTLASINPTEQVGILESSAWSIPEQQHFLQGEDALLEWDE